MKIGLQADSAFFFLHARDLSRLLVGGDEGGAAPDERHRLDHAAVGEDTRHGRGKPGAAIRPGVERAQVAAHVSHRGDPVRDPKLHPADVASRLGMDGGRGVRVHVEQAGNGEPSAAVHHVQVSR